MFNGSMFQASFCGDDIGWCSSLDLEHRDGPTRRYRSAFSNANRGRRARWTIQLHNLGRGLLSIAKPHSVARNCVSIVKRSSLSTCASALLSSLGFFHLFLSLSLSPSIYLFLLPFVLLPSPCFLFVKFTVEGGGRMSEVWLKRVIESNISVTVSIDGITLCRGTVTSQRVNDDGKHVLTFDLPFVSKVEMVYDFAKDAFVGETHMRHSVRLQAHEIISSILTPHAPIFKQKCCLEPQQSLFRRQC